MKSATVPVRFDPVMKLALELVGARERRSFSSTVERAAEQFVKTVMLSAADGSQVSFWQIADQCWNPSPSRQLYNLAMRYPELLSFDERQTWETVRAMHAFESHLSSKNSDFDLTTLWILDRIWSDVVACAAGEIDMQEMMRRYREARAACMEHSDVAAFRAVRELVAGTMSPDDFTAWLKQHPESGADVMALVGTA